MVEIYWRRVPMTGNHPFRVYRKQWVVDGITWTRTFSSRRKARRYMRGLEKR